MATSRPFSRYTNGPLSNNAEQRGNLYVGNENTLLDVGGVKWWNGPDEDLGYFIAYEDNQGAHNGRNSLDRTNDIPAFVGFKRSAEKTEASFIELVNNSFEQTFTTGLEAKAWLDANGYWASFSGFGSSGFQWMTIISSADRSASGIGQNDITVAVTQSGGGMGMTEGVYNPTVFPEEYGVPFTGNQIQNNNDGTFTAVFSQPITDALVAFASIGNPQLSVPIEVSAPFTPIFGSSVSYQNPVNETQYTGLTGNEGYAIIRIDGTVTSVTFNYTVAETYCNVCFGFVNQNTLPTPTATPVPAPTATPVPAPTATPVPAPTATPVESGSGWYFYSEEGPLDVNPIPPIARGNTIFLTIGSDASGIKTFEPNKSKGTTELYFNYLDSAGGDYTTQFTALSENGGSITITQGVNTVAYTSTTPGTFFADAGPGFFMIRTGPATETVTSANPFVFGSPITITFDPLT
jgi:hypothetical protein